RSKMRHFISLLRAKWHSLPSLSPANRNLPMMLLYLLVVICGLKLKAANSDKVDDIPLVYHKPDNGKRKEPAKIQVQPTIFCPIILVEVRNIRTGNCKLVFALLDTGASLSSISPSLVDELQLDRTI